MKKIIFILHTYSVGGAERRCIAVANYLASQGYKIKIVLLDMNKMYNCKKDCNGLEVDIGFVDSPSIKIPADKRVELVYLLHDGENPPQENNITYISFDNKDALPKDADDFIENTDTKQKSAAKKQLKQLEEIYIKRIYQYVKHLPDYSVISWMTFCNIATAAALNSLPNEFAFVECTSPDIEFQKESGFNYLKELLYCRASAAFFQTDEMRSFYTYLPEIKSFVIPNPVLINLPRKSTAGRAKYIVNFCRVEKPKNLELLIEAFSLLNKKYPAYMLHIYGDGSEKMHLKTVVRQKGLEHAVLFFDFTSDVHNRILNAAMYVSTSNREGISNSMIEAMAMGLPTICTDCHGGGARAIIKHGVNGLLVPMEDKEALFDAMKEVVEYPQLAEKLSKNALEINKTLSITQIGEAWKNAIEAEW